MLPPLRRAISQAARCAHRKTLLRLVPSTRSHHASSPFRKWRDSPTSPALLTSTWMSPKRSSAVSNRAIHSALLGDIRHHAERRTARLPDAVGDVFHMRADIVGHDARAFAAEALGDGPADAAPGAGHDDDGASKTFLLLHGLPTLRCSEAAGARGVVECTPALRLPILQCELRCPAGSGCARRRAGRPARRPPERPDCGARRAGPVHPHAGFGPHQRPTS